MSDAADELRRAADREFSHCAHLCHGCQVASFAEACLRRVD